MKIRFSDLRSTSRLFADFIYRPGALVPWLGDDFRDPESRRRTASRLNRIDFRRSELSRILLSQNTAFGASAKTLENIDLIARGDALCVVAGHQVVMLGGPLLVLYKAMTVLLLAEKLADILEQPVVPVFWLATDDHDFAEVNTVSIPGNDAKTEKIRYEPSTQVAGRPMSDIRLDQPVVDFIDRVALSLADTEFKPGLVELLKDCYSPGVPVSTAFARLLLQLLGRYGLIIVDPGAGSGLKSMEKDIFKREITGFEKVRDLAAETDTSLTDAGYHLQVRRDRKFVHLFFHDDRRRRIEYDDGLFLIDGIAETCSRNELVESIDASPQRFSPDVLLRLVVQSKLLPAVAFVGGPSEIAYFAQTPRLFSFFEVVPPVVYPRLSGTLIERRWAEFVDKHDIDLSQLAEYADREACLTSILRERFPPDVENSMIDGRNRILTEFDRMAARVRPDDQLSRTIDQSRKKIEFELGSLSDKVFKAHRKADKDFSGKFRRMAELIFPEQSLQERHCSFIYYADKYGPDILDEVLGRLDLDTCEHQVIPL